MSSPLDDAPNARMMLYTLAVVISDRMMKHRKDLVELAVDNPVDRRILAEGGIIITDEEIEFVKNMDKVE